jgi:hypothetical protein
MTDVQALQIIRTALENKLTSIDACLQRNTTLFIGAVDEAQAAVAGTVGVGGAYQEDLRQLLVSYRCQMSAELGGVNEQITQLTTPTEVHHAHLD